MGSRLLRLFEKVLTSAGSGLLRPVVSPRSSAIRENAAFERILVIRQHNQLGDMLCVVPMLRALRKSFPRATVSLLASPVNFDVMVNNAYIDETILFDKSEFLTKWSLRLSRLMSFVHDLRKRKFDLVIVPATVSVSATSNFLAYLSGAPTRIGPRSIDGRRNRTSFFFTVQLDLDWRSTPDIHQTKRNLEYLAPLKTEDEKDLSSLITLKEQEKSEAKSLILNHVNQKSSYIVFHPGAGKIPNRWSAQNFALVANILGVEFDAFVLITSGFFDGDPVQDMISTLSVPFDVLRNKPIRLVAGVLCDADLLITNDTGIMHVGGAVGAPVLSLFGPTEAHQWAPIGPAHRFIQSRDGDIDSITVEDVLRHAREMLRMSKMIRSGGRPFLAGR